MANTEGGGLTPAEVCKATGATYRQLDHWIRRGWLTVDHTGGTGNRREWSSHEITIAALMVRLVNAGLRPEAAARVARGDPLLAPGVRVEVTLG